MKKFEFLNSTRLPAHVYIRQVIEKKANADKVFTLRELWNEISKTSPAVSYQGVASALTAFDCIKLNRSNNLYGCKKVLDKIRKMMAKGVLNAYTSKTDLTFKIRAVLNKNSNKVYEPLDLYREMKLMGVETCTASGIRTMLSRHFSRVSLGPESSYYGNANALKRFMKELDSVGTEYKYIRN